MTLWARGEGLSLGLFVFVKEGKGDCIEDKKHVLSNKTMHTLTHELGHCCQSALLGPLYLLVIGLPSLCWCQLPQMVKIRKERGVSYHDFYPERWADAWGEALMKRDI